MSGLLTKRWLISLQRTICFIEYRSSYSQVLSYARIVHRNNSTSSNDEETALQVEEKIDRYAYGSESLAKKDKSAAGLFFLPTINLPAKLEENLKVFLDKYPKKILKEDGQKLSRHLKNRGRPTEATWRKYRESRISKNQDLEATAEDIKKLEEEQKQSQLIDGHTSNDGEYNQDEQINASVQTDCNEDNENDTKQQQAAEDQAPADNGENTNKMKPKVMKRPLEHYKVVRYDKRECAAFAASRIQSSYGATLRVLHEISKREPTYKPETILDFGSGTGTATWAAHNQWGESIKEYQCIDVSEHMNEVAEFLLRGSDSYKKPLHIPYVYFKRFLPVSNKVTYDVVISSYSLTELPRKATRKQAIRNLWAKANDFLVLIEYGNNEGFDILLEARNMVEKDKEAEVNEENSDDGVSQDQFEDPFADVVHPGYVFAPCPHDTTCARSIVEERDHPCNFEQNVQLAFSERHTALKKWGHATERFSFLVLRKGTRSHGETSAWPRILEPLKLRKKHIICKLCSSNGKIEKKILTKKKDSDIYKCARHLNKWGDLIPMPEERQRPLTKPHIIKTRRGKIRK